MLATLAVLACAFGNDQGFEPKVPAPVIPIPNGQPITWDYALRSDWTPFARAKPVWRTAVRAGDVWEEAVIDRAGVRLKKRVADSPTDYLIASTGRLGAGGGVGPGFEWSVYVGSEWTADVDVEFTASGLRVVLAMSYFPYQGLTRRYGWSVLSGQLVHSAGWYFSADDLRSIYYMPRFAVVMTLHGFWRSLGPDVER